MASKKKPVKKKINNPKVPKNVKMLDFTQDRTAPLAKNYEKGIKKSLINYLKGSNIPALVELSKDSDIMAHYFLNQGFYMSMLGDGIKHLNNAVKAAIVDTIMADVTIAMKSKGSVYPGIWPNGAVYAIVATRVNIRRPVDNPKAGWYLTVSNSMNNVDGKPIELTTAEMEKLPAVECMAYSDYNANRLFQFCMEAIKQAVGMIIDQIQYGVPNAYMHSSNETLQSRYAREFGTILNENLKKTNWRDTEHKDTISNLFDGLVSMIENPLIGHMTALLSLSGISPDAVAKTFKNSNATVYYSLEKADEVDDTIYDLNDVIGNMHIRYVLSAKAEGNPMQIAFIASAAELMHVADVANGDEPMPSAVSHVGAELVRFYNNLVKYSMAICVEHMNDPVETDEQQADGEPVMPEDYEGK